MILDRPSDSTPNLSITARSWLALAFFVVSYLAFDPVEAAIHRPIAHAFGLQMIQDGAMAPVPFAVLMIVRLLLDLGVVAAIIAIQGRRLADFPLVGPAMGRMTLGGLAIGLLVMVGAILAILGLDSATVRPSGQSVGSAILHGSAWLGFDFLGATGEELAGRVAVLLVALPLVGRRGAILASGILFAGIHMGNPGATWFWLLRLFVQGLLLAYAVFRTGSFWWSTGYHTGWNWASAPLFGAAGSGYLDQGHMFDFTPTGPVWITGGAVGPESSIFAYIAMLAALLLLVKTTRRTAKAPHGSLGAFQTFRWLADAKKG
ncbi:CPBP family intramembrane glutamic endopeptidase [Sphingomonas sp. UYP23]